MDRMERLILRRRRHMLFQRQLGQKVFQLLFAGQGFGHFSESGDACRPKTQLLPGQSNTQHLLHWLASSLAFGSAVASCRWIIVSSV